MRQYIPQLLALAAMASLLISLTPDSPAYGHDVARMHSVRVHAQLEQVLYEASAPLDLSVAVFTAQPWQYSTVVLGRALLAAPTSAIEGAQILDCSSPSFELVERPIWYKHRRYACQIFDTPPPYALLRAL